MPDLTDASAQDFETIRFEQAGGVARIELNRPDTLNAWIPQLGLELCSALEACREDTVRAVVISGAGKGFSSGADLNSVNEMLPSEVLQRYYNGALLAVRRLPKPVIASVHGACAGIGCSLALACDLVLMAESSFLLLAFVNVGLIPDGGASIFVTARAGGTRALAMTLLGERIPARRALGWGLTNEVVADDALGDRTSELVSLLAAGPTQAYGLAKQALNEAIYAGLEDQLELEARLQDLAAATADHRAAVEAFLARRTPEFTGVA